jgi:hypothetical protein
LMESHLMDSQFFLNQTKFQRKCLHTCISQFLRSVQVQTPQQ